MVLISRHWQGVAVSSNGRIFTSFPRGNETFTLAEANTATTEVPFPEYVLFMLVGIYMRYAQLMVDIARTQTRLRRLSTRQTLASASRPRSSSTSRRSSSTEWTASGHSTSGGRS